jgi:hypothetical protein
MAEGLGSFGANGVVPPDIGTGRAAASMRRTIGTAEAKDHRLRAAATS